MSSLFARRFRGRAAALAATAVLFACVLAIIAVGQGIDAAWLSGTESTDDAYVRADQIVISSHVSGYLDSVPVADNQSVAKDQLIAKVRDDDYLAKVENAEAELAEAKAAVGILSDQTTVQQQKVEAADAVLKQASQQLARQKNLVDEGATSRREFDIAQADESTGLANLRGNSQSLKVIERQIIAAREAVRAKTAARDLARIDLGYTRIVSPAAGQLAARIALEGQYVTEGTQIALVIPLPKVWVVANFREAQLAHMRRGQSASITVDAVPDRTFRGVVDSVSPASGALQALLPPDNATGNFTKVAQRFGVKILVDPDQGAVDRLRPGMSAVARVKICGAGQWRCAAP